jgi:hypothetical protein
MVRPLAFAHKNPTQLNFGSVHIMDFYMPMGTFLARPRLILNPLWLFVFSAVWIRDFLYWLPKIAFGTSLNYKREYGIRDFKGVFGRLCRPKTPLKSLIPYSRLLGLH